MKKICFFLLVFITDKLNAQTFSGLQAGVSSNILNINISNRKSTIISSGIGYTSGLLIEQKVAKFLFVKASPNLTSKNYSFDRTDSLAGIYTRYNNRYLQLPIEAQVVYGKRLQVFASIGIYFGYWLAGREKGKVPNIFSVTNNINTVTNQASQSFQLSAFNERYIFNLQRDNRLELGWIGDSGLQYQFENYNIIFVEGSYYKSLTDQQKKYMLNQSAQYNQTFVFSIGYLYLIK